MKILKTIMLIVITTIITICAFGGGCIIWCLLSLIIKPTPEVFEIAFYISIFVPIPFCWWIAPKFAEKYFKKY